jgi:serine/threonine protein kinase
MSSSTPPDYSSPPIIEAASSDADADADADAPPTTFSMPISTLGRHDCQTAAHLHRQRVLGKGGQGEAIAVCMPSTADTSTDCPYVLKVAQGGRFGWQRELSAMIYMQTRPTRNGHRVTPRLHDAWYCNPATNKTGDARSSTPPTDTANAAGTEYYLLMERFDGSLLDYECTFNGLTPPMLPAQIATAMFAIAEHLDAVGVVHGDLKPSNFLYRRATNTVVVADFGHSEIYNSRTRRLDPARAAFLRANANGVRMSHLDLPYPEVMPPQLNQLSLLAVFNFFNLRVAPSQPAMPVIFDVSRGLTSATFTAAALGEYIATNQAPSAAHQTRPVSADTPPKLAHILGHGSLNS